MSRYVYPALTATCAVLTAATIPYGAAFEPNAVEWFAAEIFFAGMWTFAALWMWDGRW